MTFKSGESGNPNGRPKGTGYRQQLFNTAVLPFQDVLIAKAINLALSGNEAMLRLFLERLLPSKPNDNTLNIDLSDYGDIKKASTIVLIGEKILEAVTTNEITPVTAKTFLSALDMQRKNIEVLNLENRILEIESVLKQRKGK